MISGLCYEFFLTYYFLISLKEPVLFAGTIKENIRYGTKHILALVG